MATSSYDHASTTILIFGVGSLVFVTIAFCMTFLGYALYCRLSRKAINWKAWRKPTAVLLIVLAVTVMFAFTLHIVVPALCLLAIGLFGYFLGSDSEATGDDVESHSIYYGLDASDPDWDYGQGAQSPPRF